MSILDKINEIIRDYSKQDVRFEESTAFDTMGFDSLDKVEVLMRIEEAYDIMFDDDLQVTTVGELVKEIERLKK